MKPRAERYDGPHGGCCGGMMMPIIKISPFIGIALLASLWHLASTIAPLLV